MRQPRFPDASWDPDRSQPGFQLQFQPQDGGTVGPGAIDVGGRPEGREPSQIRARALATSGLLKRPLLDSNQRPAA